MIVTMRGFKELQQRLREIGAVSGTKAMRSAMFTATRPLLDKAKASAPRRSGALSEAIARSFVVSSRGLLSSGDSGSRFSILVGPKARNRTAIALYNLVYRPRRPRRRIFHGHFFEWGTPRGVSATHWLRNALQATMGQCVQSLADTLKKRVEAAARRR